MCCVPDKALNACGPPVPIAKELPGGTAQVTPSGHGAHPSAPHHHVGLGEAIRARTRCISACAVRCIHDHLPGHQHDHQKAPAVMREEEAKKWLLVKRKDFARVRMVCFPYAGGNSNFYKTWDFKETEMVLVELPGRNARYNEKAMTDVYSIAKKIASALDAVGYLKSQIPLCLFGHSFGAILSTLVAQVLRNQYNYTPKHLIVSGCVPLHLRAGRPRFSVPNDDDLVTSLLEMGGITKEMAKNRDVVNQFLPALKGDYLAVDKYVYHEAEPLACPILALGSDQDMRVPQQETAEWARFTAGEFESRIFPGGHFFLKPLEKDVIAYMSSVIFKDVTGPGAMALPGFILFDPNKVE
jgi:surfactin synthase thioesterase subunit